MLYVLGEAFIWFVLAFVLGALVGWVVHHILRCSSSAHGAKAGKNVAASTSEADATRDAVMRAELRELRSRVAFLEPAQDERDRLRRDLADLRAARVVESSELSQQVESAGVDFDDSQALRAEVGALRALVSRHEATVGIQAATINRLHSQLDSESSSAPPTPDLRAAEAVLARRVKLDDLTVVVGIDRESAALCHQQGISTWWALANTDVRALRAMLAQAGRDAREHDPSSWPQQARLLANGSWQQFVDLTG